MARYRMPGSFERVILRVAGAAVILLGVFAFASGRAGPFSGSGPRYVTGPPAIAYGVVFVIWGVGLLLLASRSHGPSNRTHLHIAGALVIAAASFVGLLTSFAVRGC